MQYANLICKCKCNISYTIKYNLYTDNNVLSRTKKKEYKLYNKP